jgi:hypothetical protein
MLSVSGELLNRLPVSRSGLAVNDEAGHHEVLIIARRQGEDKQNLKYCQGEA